MEFTFPISYNYRGHVICTDPCTINAPNLSPNSSPLLSTSPHASLSQHHEMPLSRSRWKYTEDDMAEAILDITDNGLSQYRSAQKWGVPQRTLSARLNGRLAVNEQIQPGQRLSKNQEDKLAFWILRQESLGYAPSHSQIRACVMGLLRQQGEQPELGRNWVARFI